MSGNANRAEICAVLGMTGTGKTQWLIQRIARPKRKRLMIWSPKEVIDNYAQRFGGQKVTSAKQCLDAAIASRGGSMVIVFAPPGARKADTMLFSQFCEIAMKARNVTVIVEELHTVTKPSAAPDGWAKLCMMGRGYGAEIFALSQRPASCDKAFMGNLSFIHSGRLGYEEDAKVVGKLLNLPHGDLLNLPDMHYLEREPRAMGPAKSGIVKYKK